MKISFLYQLLFKKYFFCSNVLQYYSIAPPMVVHTNKHHRYVGQLFSSTSWICSVLGPNKPRLKMDFVVTNLEEAEKLENLGRIQVGQSEEDVLLLGAFLQTLRWKLKKVRQSDNENKYLSLL